MRYLLASLCFWTVIVAFSGAGEAADEYQVSLQNISDPKVVFATVESTDVVSARARITGTIVSLNVKEGDMVQAGQEIAVVGDDKLALQVKTLDAQIAGLLTQAERANADYKRTESLIGSGAVAKSTLETAKATASSANNELKARRAQRELIEQQVTEGKILSPAVGRILHVPLTAGSVVMAGEPIATIAADSYVLRIQLPERHAQYIKKGDKVRLDGSELGNKKLADGQVSLVYPAIENGRVQADIIVQNLENYFVGERVRVWVFTTQREAIIVPKKFISTRSGVDYVRLKLADNKAYEVPVQVGHSQVPDLEDKVEILTGVKDKDILISP